MIEEIAIILTTLTITIGSYSLGYHHGKKARVTITMPEKINLEAKSK